MTMQAIPMVIRVKTYGPRIVGKFESGMAALLFGRTANNLWFGRDLLRVPGFGRFRDSSGCGGNRRPAGVSQFSHILLTIDNWRRVH